MYRKRTCERPWCLQQQCVLLFRVLKEVVTLSSLFVNKPSPLLLKSNLAALIEVMALHLSPEIEVILT